MGKEMSSTKVILLTPEEAKGYLRLNTHNRRVNVDRVRLLAEAMVRGEWMETHQGLAFDHHGVMIDGQHRCLAVIESGVSVPIRVTTGLDPDTFAVVDALRPRGAGDVLGLNGVRNGSHVASVLRMLDRYVCGEPRPWNSRRLQMTNVQIVAAHDKWGHLVPDSTGIVRSIYKRIGASRTGMSVAFIVAQRWCEYYDVAGLAEWTEGLVSGANLGSGDPRLALASYVAGPMGGVQYNYRSEVTVMAALRAFYLHVKDEPLKIMRVLEPSTYMYRLPGFEPEIMREAFAESKSEASDA